MNEFKHLNKVITIESFDTVKKAEVVESLAILKLLQDEVELATARLKEIAVRRNYSKEILVNYGLKVEVKEGKSTTVFDAETIGKIFQQKNRTKDFFKIVNVVQSKAIKNLKPSDPIWSAIEEHREKTTGSKYVMVSKLTKDELSKAI